MGKQRLYIVGNCVSLLTFSHVNFLLEGFFILCFLIQFFPFIWHNIFLVSYLEKHLNSSLLLDLLDLITRESIVYLVPSEIFWRMAFHLPEKASCGCPLALSYKKTLLFSKWIQIRITRKQRELTLNLVKWGSRWQ